jgi:pyruvate/2-oxoglutarate/acetoin dehydrogenase E1 component
MLAAIGDVNHGLQWLCRQNYGEERIFDCGIRELTIMGQGSVIAMRGLRPIAEIQYLDYLLYGLEPLSDDAATRAFQNKRKTKLSIDRKNKRSSV